FFPAFPLAVRVVALLFGGSKAAFILGGTVVSLGAFLAALTYVYLLAREELDDDQARAALWLLAAYPFACFFGAIYTESLFLLGAAGAFYHFRRGEWWRSGAWGVLVGLTRPNGFLLGVPLAILAFSPWLPSIIVRGRTKRVGAAHVRPTATDRTEHRLPLQKSLWVAAMP